MVSFCVSDSFGPQVVFGNVFSVDYVTENRLPLSPNLRVATTFFQTQTPSLTVSSGTPSLLRTTDLSPTRAVGRPLLSPVPSLTLTFRPPSEVYTVEVPRPTRSIDPGHVQCEVVSGVRCQVSDRTVPSGRILPYDRTSPRSVPVRSGSLSACNSRDPRLSPLQTHPTRRGSSEDFPFTRSVPSDKRLSVSPLILRHPTSPHRRSRVQGTLAQVF